MEKSKRTMREEFEISKAGLLAQGRKSLNGPSGSCVMRGTLGTCCALGFLISEEQGEKVDGAMVLPQPTELMDGSESSKKQTEDFFNIATDLNPDHVDFYVDLQCVHDECLPEKWESALDHVEKEWFSET